MESIAVTRPDMAVISKDSLGLSLFGLVAMAFSSELEARSMWTTGFYRDIPLELLEDADEQKVPKPVRELQLNVDFKFVLEALKKEKSQSDTRRAGLAERILERVYLLERRTERTNSISSHITLRLEPGRTGLSEPRRLTASVKQAVQEPAARWMTEYRLLRTVREEKGLSVAPLKPVVWSTAIPAGNGWKPQWQEAYPGYSQKRNPDKKCSATSILLPDLLRRKREIESKEEDAPQERGLVGAKAGGEDLVRRMVEFIDKAAGKAADRKISKRTNTTSEALDTAFQSALEPENHTVSGQRMEGERELPGISPGSALNDADARKEVGESTVVAEAQRKARATAAGRAFQKDGQGISFGEMQYNLNNPEEVLEVAGRREADRVRRSVSESDRTGGPKSPLGSEDQETSYMRKPTLEYQTGERSRGSRKRTAPKPDGGSEAHHVDAQKSHLNEVSGRKTYASEREEVSDGQMSGGTSPNRTRNIEEAQGIKVQPVRENTVFEEGHNTEGSVPSDGGAVSKAKDIESAGVIHSEEADNLRLGNETSTEHELTDTRHRELASRASGYITPGNIGVEELSYWTDSTEALSGSDTLPLNGGKNTTGKNAVMSRGTPENITVTTQPGLRREVEERVGRGGGEAVSDDPQSRKQDSDVSHHTKSTSVNEADGIRGKTTVEAESRGNIEDHPAELYQYHIQSTSFNAPSEQESNDRGRDDIEVGSRDNIENYDESAPIQPVPATPMSINSVEAIVPEKLTYRSDESHNPDAIHEGTVKNSAQTEENGHDHFMSDTIYAEKFRHNLSEFAQESQSEPHKENVTQPTAEHETTGAADDGSLVTMSYGGQPTEPSKDAEHNKVSDNQDKRDVRTLDTLIEGPMEVNDDEGSQAVSYEGSVPGVKTAIRSEGDRADASAEELRYHTEGRQDGFPMGNQSELFENFSTRSGNDYTAAGIVKEALSYLVNADSPGNLSELQGPVELHPEPTMDTMKMLGGSEESKAVTNDASPRMPAFRMDDIVTGVASTLPQGDIVGSQLLEDSDDKPAQAMVYRAIEEEGTQSTPLEELRYISDDEDNSAIPQSAGAASEPKWVKQTSEPESSVLPPEELNYLPEDRGKPDTLMAVSGSRGTHVHKTDSGTDTYNDEPDNISAEKAQHHVESVRPENPSEMPDTKPVRVVENRQSEKEYFFTLAEELSYLSESETGSGATHEMSVTGSTSGWIHQSEPESASLGKAQYTDTTDRAGVAESTSVAERAYHNIDDLTVLRDIAGTGSVRHNMGADRGGSTSMLMERHADGTERDAVITDGPENVRGTNHLGDGEYGIPSKGFLYWERASPHETRYVLRPGGQKRGTSTSTGTIKLSSHDMKGKPAFQLLTKRGIITPQDKPFTYASQSHEGDKGELTYLPVFGNPPDHEKPPPQKDKVSYMGMDKLPEWVQRFLKQPPASAQNAPERRKWPEKQIEWSAPNAPFTQLVFHEKDAAERQHQPQGQFRLSDSELRRAADKVYKLIEERLRRELRRKGR